MLQRVQNLYLFIAALTSSLLLVFPIFKISVSDNTNQLVGTFGAYGLVSDAENVSYPIYIVYFISIMLSVFAFFLFKKRNKQILVTRLNLIYQIIVAISFLLFFLIGENVITNQLSELSESSVALELASGYYILFISIPLLLLAIRGIKKDEELLRSIDRIR